MERHVKFSTAATLVGFPSTVLALYVNFPTSTFQAVDSTNLSKGLLFGVFALCSSVVLFFMGGGIEFMLRARRTHGIRWWGGDLQGELARALEMTFFGVSRISGCWLVLVALLIEAQVGLFAPILGLKIFDRA